MSKSYGNIRTLGRAVNKVKHALPSSPRKKNAILTHIVAKLDESEKENLVQVVSKSTFKRKSIQVNLIRVIHKFYERDDISRVSPRTNDVKSYKCPQTGEELYLPTRHLVLSVKEAYALFIQERNNEGKIFQMIVNHDYENLHTYF